MFPISGSSLYHRVKLELGELESLKWIESEKAGHDIGWNRARWIWYTQHRHKWVEAMRTKGIDGF